MWLIEPAVAHQLRAAYESGLEPTAEDRQALTALFDDESREGSRLLTVAGGTARIEVTGILTQAPDFIARIIGGGNATYREVIRAVAEAEQDPAVQELELFVNSPGGELDGLFDLLAGLEQAEKPITAVVSGKAASAAFAIVSQADRIVAATPTARFGGVGVVMEAFVDPESVTITSTNAPKKRPDLTTDAGRAIVREELDALHEIFVEAIARGRGTTTERVNADFGEGAMVLAREALSRGMIDEVTAATPSPVPQTTTTARSGGTEPRTGAMDLQTLKVQHPAVFAAAVQEGVEQERERVTAHVIMGEQCGALDTAAKAIKDGTGLTASLQATYLTAGVNRQDRRDRADDDAAAAAAADGADTDTGADPASTIADQVCSALGAQEA